MRNTWSPNLYNPLADGRLSLCLPHDALPSFLQSKFALLLFLLVLLFRLRFLCAPVIPPASWPRYLARPFPPDAAAVAAADLKLEETSQATSKMYASTTSCERKTQKMG